MAATTCPVRLSWIRMVPSVVGNPNSAGLDLYTVTALMPSAPLDFKYAGMYAIHPPTASSVITVRWGIVAVPRASSEKADSTASMAVGIVNTFWTSDLFSSSAISDSTG